MEYENNEVGLQQAHKLPEGCRCPNLRGQPGLNLPNSYRQMLLDLTKSVDPLNTAIYADTRPGCVDHATLLLILV